MRRSEICMGNIKIITWGTWRVKQPDPFVRVNIDPVVVKILPPVTEAALATRFHSECLGRVAPPS